MAQIIITVGLPASGKTTWAEKQIAQSPKFVNINSDDIRLMLTGRSRYDKHHAWRERVVAETVRHSVIAALQAGKAVIISDCNLDPQRNRAWKDLAKSMGIAYKEQLFTDITYGECIQRDARREHPVGAKIIMGLYDMYREHWWPAPVEHSEGLPDAYIFDVDGTLAQMNGRGPFDWSRVGEDLPRLDVIAMLQTLRATGKQILIVSGRDGVCQKQTDSWFTHHDVVYDQFWIRPPGDCRGDMLIKEEIYHRNIKGKYNVLGVFDDRDQVVHMWRHYGLTVFQVNYGAF